MKRVIIGIAVLVILLFCVISAQAEVISWKNPITYADGSAISTTDQGKIQTFVKIKAAGETDFVLLGTVKYGGKTWNGTLPYDPGTVVQINLVSNLYSLDSVSLLIDYTIPTIPPSPPTEGTVSR